MYKLDSKIADEFINHQEISETLDYAEKNKNNKDLLDEVLEKAKKEKGLNHREAALLLLAEDKYYQEEIYKLAKKIKEDHYGNRIVLFAPLYLSNYCINGCVYCPYHAKNKSIRRKNYLKKKLKVKL